MDQATPGRTGDDDFGLSAAAQVVPFDPRALAAQVPPMRSFEQRTRITQRCRDADVLDKVPGAGGLSHAPDGTEVQLMFNGIQVVAGGYYGPWQQDLITRCHGHHEPQEEVVFAELLRHLPPQATMIELGGFWSLYSIWFLMGEPGRRAVVVEPDPAHLEIGRRNAALNGVSAEFVIAFVGGEPRPPELFATENSGMVATPCVSVPSLVHSHSIDHLDLLHCDAQGVELAVVESIVELAQAGRIGWLVLSTHHHSISGDPLTHQRCLALLRHAGATILVEHDVQESFSGDGLIVAKFGAVPTGWQTPKLSHNRYSESLFRNPLFDLAALQPSAPTQAAIAVAAAEANGLLPTGALLTLGRDGPLGRYGDNILMPFDQVMYPLVARQGGWALETLAFLAERVDPARAWLSLDIGANVGLYTRQLAFRFPAVQRFVCVEADSGNMRALRYNLLDMLGPRGQFHNIALSDTDGTAGFFRERTNIGNYSLHREAMGGAAFDAIEVQVADAATWLPAYLDPEQDQSIIWKSGTQGHDEVIIARTPMALWHRVHVATAVLWRMGKADFDRAAFAARVADFPNRSIGRNGQASTEEVMQFLDSEDGHQQHLYLWR